LQNPNLEQGKAKAMSVINPAQAALSRWMNPSVARSWIAQITRYSQRRRTSFRRYDDGEAAFRMVLRCDWVRLNLPPSRSSFSP
jgi:hypothetical protein